MSENMKGHLSKETLGNVKSWDTNGDGYLGSAERADAMIKRANETPCATHEQRQEEYRAAFGVTTNPTDKELNTHLGNVSKILEGEGRYFPAAVLEGILQNNKDIQALFPKGVEHTTPEDLKRSADVTANRAIGCIKAETERGR